MTSYPKTTVTRAPKGRSTHLLTDARGRFTPNVTEIDVEMFVLLNDIIIDHANLELALSLPRMEDQRSVGVVVIRTDVGRPIFGPIVDVGRRVGDVTALRALINN